MTNLSPPERTPTASVRKGPALIVIGLAFALLLGGAGLALAFGSRSRSTGTTSLATPSACPAVPALETARAAPLLRRLGPSGAIPSDIAGALFVPADSTVTGTKDFDHSSGQFDRELDLRTPDAPETLVSCYGTGLRALGWKLSFSPQTDTASGRPTERILAERPSVDGYYWEVGITVRSRPARTTPTAQTSPPGSRTSSLSLRLLEVPDAS